MPRAKRRTAYHEAGHAVAHHFFRLAGRSMRLTMHADDLADYNATRHAVNQALGFHSSGRTLPAIVGRSVDREQLHHELIALLAGPAAGWVFAGEFSREPRQTPQEVSEIQRHADGGDDHSRALALLFDADPFEAEAALARVRGLAQGRASTEALAEPDFQPACDAHMARVLTDFEQRWREALLFVVEKWLHVQAVADALWRKRVLTGDEVREIIDRAEFRGKTLPPSLVEQIEKARRDRAADGG